MKILRQKQKRRTAGRGIPAVLLFFLFFPYAVSLLKEGGRQALPGRELLSDIWVETQKSWGVERMQLEEFLVGMMAACIPLDYEEETLKAQSIILRSWCRSLAERKDGIDRIPAEELEEMWISKEQLKKIWGEDYEKNKDRIVSILEQTKGMVLVWKKEIIKAPFFPVSNGTTRFIGEYQESMKIWEYLIPLSCPADMEAKEYLGRVEVPKREFEKKIAHLLEEEEWKLDKVILHRDGADYVKAVEIDGRQIQGEQFRHTFDLPSACFTLEKQGDRMVMKTRGVGHGFGFSQYQANELAKQGKDFRQLLESFFTGISVERR